MLMENNMKDSTEQERGMVLENTLTIAEQHTMVNGLMTRKLAMDATHLLMENTTLDSIKMEYAMAKVNSITTMVQCMMVHGKMTKSMVMPKSQWLMVQSKHRDGRMESTKKLSPDLIISFND